MRGTKGLRRAREALSWAFDNAWSPMEAGLALVLSAPRPQGGYGLPKPQLNYRVEADAGRADRQRRRFFVADLYWEQAKLIVEYDSDLEHANPEALAADAARRVALMDMGYEVVTVTAGQMRDLDSFDRLAQMLSRRLGVKQRPADAELLGKRRALLGLVLHA